MTLYIFRGNECIDTYELPELISWENLIAFNHWNSFGAWLFHKGYVRPEYKIEFK